MTDAEKIAADAVAKRAAEAAKAKELEAIEADILKDKEKDDEIAKLREERDNYKTVALKRLGKLPADSEFLGEHGGDIQALIEDKIKSALIDKELDLKTKAREEENRKILRENSELKLLIKNRPGGPTDGGGNGNGVEVKDNVFSNEQIAALRNKAIRLKADPDKFVENAKLNLMSRK